MNYHMLYIFASCVTFVRPHYSRSSNVYQQYTPLHNTAPQKHRHCTAHGIEVAPVDALGTAKTQRYCCACAEFQWQTSAAQPRRPPQTTRRAFPTVCVHICYTHIRDQRAHNTQHTQQISRRPQTREPGGAHNIETRKIYKRFSRARANGLMNTVPLGVMRWRQYRARARV